MYAAKLKGAIQTIKSGEGFEVRKRASGSLQLFVGGEIFWTLTKEKIWRLKNKYHLDGETVSREEYFILALKDEIAIYTKP